MKLETLANKIGHKAGEPLLREVMLRRRPIEDLPDRCLIWTGSVKGKDGHTRFVRRNHPLYGLETSHRMERAYSSIQFQKGHRHVPQLIISHALQLDYKFRLENLCGNTLCVHPTHWIPHRVGGELPPAPEPDLELMLEDEWTEAEMEEVLEIALTEKDVKSFDELMALDLMEGAPPDLVRQVLTSMNKEHLT